MEVYELEDLYDDQKVIASKFLEKIKEFMTMKDLSKFEPLMCTIVGEGGTGKTVLINTLTSVTRRMFDRTDVVRVGAPTGVAACNVGGETLHRLTASRPNRKEGEYKANSMQHAQTDKLSLKFKHLVMMIVDERSMLSSLLLGETGQKIGETIFEGGHTRDEIVGAMPIFALAGDDYQLPPPVNQGAIEAATRRDKGQMTQKGRQIFLDCTEKVFILTQNKRLSDDKQQDRDMLGRVRVGENILDQDVAKIKSLHIDEIEKVHGAVVATAIKAKSVYLFWTNEKRIRHNIERLAHTNTEENPTAFIKTHSTGGRYGKGVNSHFESDLPKTALLCQTAMAAVDGCNFCPLWGVHNGACGRVVEIVFRQGENPNHGHLPVYVVLDLPLYSGPPWDLDNPTYIPIPTCEVMCSSNCCTRKYMPLDLAFARTIHRFQGLSAGPVDKGKIKNMYDSIICDPDGQHAETRATGLLYTALSRATTFGDDDGLNSAIYFMGTDLTTERIQEVTRAPRAKHELINVTRRRHWVKRLEGAAARQTKTNINTKKFKDLMLWATTKKYSYDDLYWRTKKYVDARRKKHI